MKIVGLNTVFTDKVKSFIKGTPMAKVYCKDCRYHKYWKKYNFDICNSRWKKVFCAERNANNDCKDFKRKCWKIWIRN